MIEGRVRINNYYSDCLPAVVIHIKNPPRECLPPKETRWESKLVIGGDPCRITLTYYPKKNYVKISPDLYSADGKKYRLVDVLYRCGYRDSRCLLLDFRPNYIEVVSA